MFGGIPAVNLAKTERYVHKGFHWPWHRVLLLSDPNGQDNKSWASRQQLLFGYEDLRQGVIKSIKPLIIEVKQKNVMLLKMCSCCKSSQTKISVTVGVINILSILKFTQMIGLKITFWHIILNKKNVIWQMRSKLAHAHSLCVSKPSPIQLGFVKLHTYNQIWVADFRAVIRDHDLL